MAMLVYQRVTSVNLQLSTLCMIGRWKPLQRGHLPIDFWVEFWHLPRCLDQSGTVMTGFFCRKTTSDWDPNDQMDPLRDQCWVDHLKENISPEGKISQFITQPFSMGPLLKVQRLLVLQGGLVHARTPMQDMVRPPDAPRCFCWGFFTGKPNAINHPNRKSLMT